MGDVEIVVRVIGFGRDVVIVVRAIGFGGMRRERFSSPYREERHCPSLLYKEETASLFSIEKREGVATTEGEWQATTEGRAIHHRGGRAGHHREGWASHHREGRGGIAFPTPCWLALPPLPCPRLPYLWWLALPPLWWPAFSHLWWLVIPPVCPPPPPPFFLHREERLSSVYRKGQASSL